MHENTTVSRLLDRLLPHRCLLCQLPSERSIALCRYCESSLVANSCHCRQCALPLIPTAHIGADRFCADCLASPPAYTRVIAPLVYDANLAFLISLWKYHRQQDLTPLLAWLWLQNAPVVQPPDLLLAVPLHWRRLLRRGFNQAELLLRAITRACPALREAERDTQRLRRLRATPAQAARGAAARATNLAGAFTVTRRCDNLRVAVIDDVLTTGSTATAIAAELRRAGAADVEFWCLARTPAPSR